MLYSILTGFIGLSFETWFASDPKASSNSKYESSTYHQKEKYSTRFRLGKKSRSGMKILYHISESLETIF
jgi:hypothetical protein